MTKFSLLSIFLLLPACQTLPDYTKTASDVDMDKFLGSWYVIASRPTFLEKGVYNATERYTKNEKSGEIDVLFSYNKDSPTGGARSMRQTARIYNPETNAHWKISPEWIPFEFDYLVIDLEPNYEWTVIGVPNQKYLWVMARRPEMTDEKLGQILNKTKKSGYDVSEVVRVPQASR